MITSGSGKPASGRRMQRHNLAGANLFLRKCDAIHALQRLAVYVRPPEGTRHGIDAYSLEQPLRWNGASEIMATDGIEQSCASMHCHVCCASAQRALRTVLGTCGPWQRSTIGPTRYRLMTASVGSSLMISTCMGRQASSGEQCGACQL